MVCAGAKWIAHESDQSRALHALRELMGAIYRIGSRVYPHEGKRLFVHQMGDGFAIVNDFGEASLERPLGIAAALMRHVASTGTFTARRSWRDHHRGDRHTPSL